MAVLRFSHPTFRSTSLPGSMLRHQHSYSGPPVGVSCTIVRSPAHSPPRMRRDTAPTLPFKQRSNSTSRPPEDPPEGAAGKSYTPSPMTWYRATSIRQHLPGSILLVKETENKSKGCQSACRTQFKNTEWDWRCSMTKNLQVSDL